MHHTALTRQEVKAVAQHLAAPARRGAGIAGAGGCAAPAGGAGRGRHVRARAHALPLREPVHGCKSEGGRGGVITHAHQGRHPARSRPLSPAGTSPPPRRLGNTHPHRQTLAGGMPAVCCRLPGCGLLPAPCWPPPAVKQLPRPAVSGPPAKMSSLGRVTPRLATVLSRVR